MLLGHHTPPTAHYFYRLRNDSRITEFCVAGATDPHQFVESLAPDGTRQRWPSRREGDLLVFSAPDGYTDGPCGHGYDGSLQRCEPAPREVLEREALRNRVSVAF